MAWVVGTMVRVLVVAVESVQLLMVGNCAPSVTATVILVRIPMLVPVRVHTAVGMGCAMPVGVDPQPAVAPLVELLRGVEEVLVIVSSIAAVAIVGVLLVTPYIAISP